MNNLIKAIITFSLKNRFFVFFIVALLAIAGFLSFIKMPIEAFPDVTNTQIIIVSQWRGRSAEEVERFVTIPIEVSMNSVQRKTNIRSTTMFGLSVIKVIFEDDVEDFFARQQVNNQLHNVSLPAGVEPDIMPPYGPTGEIFRYTLKSRTKNSRELLTIQNWIIDRRLRSVPGVADIVTFGGEEKIYEISLDPLRLSKYDITPLEIHQAVSKSNQNVGGDVLVKNGQAFVIRGIGMLNSTADIEDIIVENIDGQPVFIKDIAEVVEKGAPRVGQVGLNDDDDVVEGIIVMRKGENPSQVLSLVKSKIKELNEKVLPKDVQIVSFYDRDKLIGYCTHTVLKNLLEGILLVTLIVFLFMADWRVTLIVSIIIPLSLMFAFLCLKLNGMSANLLSLGAIDFGIIVDGAVVMVEGIFVSMAHLAHRYGPEKFNQLSKLGTIRKTGVEMGKAIFFSKIIIITALIPIFSFQKVEGKMFSPLAYTLGFALLGALIFTLTLVPQLCAILLKKDIREKENIFVKGVNKIFYNCFNWSFANKKISLFLSALFLMVVLLTTKWMGTEFLPQLNEGALWVEAKLPMSSSLEETVKTVKKLRHKISGFEEVDGVLSQTGRSNDGTDPCGFYYVQMQVNLKPQKEWKRKLTIDGLIEEIDSHLKQYQGIVYNYSQPIIDNVAESVAGINASNAVKIEGNDFGELDRLADSVLTYIKDINGVKDAGVIRNIGQPEISIILDQQKMALFGINISDAQSIIEMAIGGKTVTQRYEGEMKFDVKIRYKKEFRNNIEDIKMLKIAGTLGYKVPLKEISEIKMSTGPAFVYRDNNKRFIAIKFSIRERDLGNTIKDAQKSVHGNITFPEGYTTSWTGEFENQVRASKRLASVTPVCLIVIFIILFIMFGKASDSALVLLNVPFAVIGGILMLHATGINFGISAGVGFIALFGICIQNGVILISVFNKNTAEGQPLPMAIQNGIRQRIRPVVMTALMAAIGLLPAALSTGIGSETQKPLAVVIIGGLITSTILTITIFPNIYWLVKRKRPATS